MIRNLLMLCAFFSITACTIEKPVPIVKVGLLAPFEGERRALGYQLLPAIQAAAGQEVQGRVIEWVILDTGSDPATAVHRARELVVDPDVMAIVGPLLPEQVEAVAPVVEQAGIAWWPLAPSGTDGMLAWHGGLGDELAPLQEWGALAWPAIRRGDATLYLDPAVPEGDASEEESTLWVGAWLVRKSVEAMFNALEQAAQITRPAVAARAESVEIPPPVLYASPDAAFPGVPMTE